MMGFGDILKKGTGMDYLNGDKPDERKKEPEKKKADTLNKQDDKFLKYLEQNLKRVNNEVEEMLEKVRVRRGL